jgi:DNA gyrase subunit A
MNKVSLLDFARENMLIYGKLTIEQRAIADYRDGLKPVQRRILWAAYKLGLHPQGHVKKSARLVGEGIGKYHPHGESSLYDALAKMTRCAEPMIDGSEANFGDYEDEAAASRYTVCKLTPYSDKYLLDPDYLALTPMVDNYDGEFQEPIYLPAKLPNLLINGCEGIATGCSVLIPSFSLESVKELVREALEIKGEVDTDLCSKKLKFHFPYGGIYDGTRSIFKKYLSTGFGSLRFTPKYKIMSDRIVVSSIAPRFLVSSKFEKIVGMKGVKTAEDRREGGNIRFDILLNRNADVEKIENILRTSLPCQTYLTMRQDDGETVNFKPANIPEFMNMWMEWRIAFEKKVVQRLIDIEVGKQRVQEWWMFAIHHKKEILKALESQDPEKNLIRQLKIKEEQAKFILEMKVRNLAKAEEGIVKNKLKQHKDRANTLNRELKNVKGRIASNL